MQRERAGDGVAEGVERSELWWVPSLNAIAETSRGAVNVVARNGVTRVSGLARRDELPEDAVRLLTPSWAEATSTTEGVELAVPDEAVEALETHALDTLRLAVHGDDSGRDTEDHVRAIAAPVVAAELKAQAARLERVVRELRGDTPWQETLRGAASDLRIRADELEGKR